MAHSLSAKKRIRQSLKKAEVNQANTSRMRTSVKKVEVAIANNNKEEAQNAFQAAQPEIHRSVNKGILHRNTAARKLSRLSARIKALA
ncbi:MAG TPA: 30S ribosomal protein S20 [Alphaproteobacteria bacterium]|mgnify:CR=1 FL=1|jgi:small subunit ribosomal protein S20|nr:30S ribosomal protein S20 [Alphaproteobacteria bacterium]HMS44634.1 30S ribosomal protein S20 [Alphaproteobacteria bacterium]